MAAFARHGTARRAPPGTTALLVLALAACSPRAPSGPAPGAPRPPVTSASAPRDVGPMSSGGGAPLAPVRGAGEPRLPAARAPTRPQLTVGRSFSCLLRTTGEARCWGNDLGGALGTLAAEGSHVPRPVALPRPAYKLKAHELSLCALLDHGGVACLGRGFGAGPAVVRGLPESVDVAVGDGFACALGRDARVRCFGRNDSGELGDGTTRSRAEPALVAGLGDAVEVGAASDHACVVLIDGTARCWGSNDFGELGDGTEAPRQLSPAPVVGLERVAHVEPGGEMSCAFLEGGAARCWGWNLERRPHGEDLTALETHRSRVPFHTPGLRQIAFGNAHACGILEGGRVRCWGLDAYGEAGPAAFGPRGPGRAGDVRDPVAIAASPEHTCVLLPGEDERGAPRVRCWGQNASGELGAPTPQGWSRAPVAVRFR